LTFFKIVLKRTHNPKVAGSSPVLATSKIKASQKCEAFFILGVKQIVFYSDIICVDLVRSIKKNL